MCRPQHNIDGVRMFFHDHRHCVDGVLNALAGAEQTKGQDDLPVLDAELVFVEAGIHKWDIGNAVRDHHDLVLRHPVDMAEHLTARPDS